MESKETSKKRIYLKWPWNVLVYIVLVVLLRIFAIPVILLIMWWNKKQQPDGPEKGYCLQRTRGRLTGLIWAALFLIGAAVRLFKAPLKLALQVLGNTLLGFGALLLLNLTSAVTGVALGVNLLNALVIGVLGVPGLGLLVLLQWLFT